MTTVSKKIGKEIECVRCGKKRYCPPSDIRRYCGATCYHAAKREKRVKNGESRCAKCRTWKPISEFVRGVGGRPHSYCKPCSSKWFHERRGTPPEKRQAYRPAYRLTEEEKKENKRRANHLAHQARRAAGPKPRSTDIERMLCWQDYQCAYCGVPILNEPNGFHIDHKTPIKHGGTNDLGNLQLLCAHCNIVKGAMTDEEFLVSKKNRRRYVKNSEL